MQFCGACGSKLEDNVKFCPACGAAVAPAAQEPAPVEAPAHETPIQEVPPVQAAAPVQEVPPVPPIPPVQPAPGYQGQQSQGQTQGTNGQGHQTNMNFFEKTMNTKDATGEFDPKDIEENKIMALFSYLGILFLIPLLAAPNSKYAKFHANQGVVLLITEALGSVAIWIVSFIFGIIAGIGPSFLAVIFGILSFLVGIISFVFGIACFVCVILGIVNAVNGKAKELPLIGKVKIIK